MASWLHLYDVENGPTFSKTGKIVSTEAFTEISGFVQSFPLYFEPTRAQIHNNQSDIIQLKHNVFSAVI